MSTDNPDISMLKPDRPVVPPKCHSCGSPIDQHNGECRCS